MAARQFVANSSTVQLVIIIIIILTDVLSTYAIYRIFLAAIGTVL